MQSRFARGAVEVRSKYGRGSLAKVRSRYCEGSFELLVRFARGAVRSRYIRTNYSIYAGRSLGSPAPTPRRRRNSCEHRFRVCAIQEE